MWRWPVKWIALVVLAGCGDSGGGGGGGGGGGLMGHAYSTTFDRNQSPISENGFWVHHGLDWAFVDTEGGVAFGTQTGFDNYDDSYAHLTGFPPDVTVSAVVHEDPDLDPSCRYEVELHLRWSDGPHEARGYECIIARGGGGAGIVRWNGPLGDFTEIASTSGSVPGGLHSGDTITATSRGNLLTLFVNGVEILRATDSTWKDGNPGMGFFLRAHDQPCTGGVLGFTRFEASPLP